MSKVPEKKTATATKPSGKTPTQNIFAKRLAAMNDRWDTAKSESSKSGGGGVTVEDGRYNTRLTAAELRDGKDNSIYVLFQFTVVEGDSTGETIGRIAGFETDDKMIYLQRDLRRLGEDVDDFEIIQLPATLAKLTKNAPGVRLTVKTKGEYTNVYIDKLVELEDGGVGEPSATEDETAEEEPVDEEEETTEEADEAEAEAEETEVEEEWAAGDDATLKFKGKKVTGTVKKIVGDLLVVKVDKTGEMVKINKNDAEKIIDTSGD